jgi:predicted nucleotidyltransferase
MTVDEIKTKIIPILKEAGVTHSSLFGSYVRNEETENSDVDILVEYPTDKSLFDFIETKLQLEDALGKKVDLIEYKTIKPQLKKYILSEQHQII